MVSHGKVWALWKDLCRKNKLVFNEFFLYMLHLWILKIMELYCTKYFMNNKNLEKKFKNVLLKFQLQQS